MTKQFTDRCATCQQMKTNTHPTAAPLMPIKSHAHRPFQQVMMDFITDLPISNGFDSIFIMVDQGLSKGVILCPCNKTIDAEGTILLARNGSNDETIYRWMCYLSTNEDKHPSNCRATHADQITHSLTISTSNDGFHHRSANQ